MTELTTTALAKELGVSKGRISQLVSEGKLSGCFRGDGRARRFDLAACAAALNRKLDPGQMMGNGAETRRRLRDLSEQGGESDPQSDDSRPLKSNDPDRYEMARTLKAEEEARKLRRQNAEAEGEFVLASAAQQQAARMLALEIAQVEVMLRDAARAVADELGVDYLVVRAKLMDQWRAHRGDRAAVLTDRAVQADMSATESEANF